MLKTNDPNLAPTRSIDLFNNTAILLVPGLVTCPHTFRLAAVTSTRGSDLNPTVYSSMISLNSSTGVVSLANFYSLDYTVWNNSVIKIAVQSENFNELPAKTLL